VNELNRTTDLNSCIVKELRNNRSAFQGKVSLKKGRASQRFPAIMKGKKRLFFL
jgi:hypothetical protein